MTLTFIQRIVRSKSLYFVLLIGLTSVFLQFKFEILPLQNMYKYNLGVAFTPYTKWFEFGSASQLAGFYFLLLPILAALPFADTYAKDKQSGYLRSILSKGQMKQYFQGLYLSNFIVSGVIIIIPLLVNIYLSFMMLPNIKPDPLVNNQMALDLMNTFFPALYYSHPFLHMLLYLLLAFFFAGMFATICLSISIFIRNRFIILVAGFLVQMVLSLLAQFTEHYEWIPSYFLMEIGSANVSFSTTVIIFCLGMIISTLVYILGVKKRVIT
ncbi:hypothetical protein HV454_13175 [Bacillus sporothermodurans]|uniref:hypothetical protein n=1 Tax=Heyndrickxia sporothermodurans TaxID=46224 RepID=UPI00192C488B|nr:hypothetical protein [Heyndrickxia sporothermodurans]MBL5772261.1 hypothetical protein [Heyndrickxia sporothermodurans]MBL5779355.1 hypothetical protein [Heyndrickxia sporothermodurans]MBL5786454.1 hypothetical protein [Heyndrickxia sporothermodurans]MBL5790001.1 hypothetical protein [Heyndrickxia sporothermodurans]MBL5801470.1 hypothetical protein [Heyndrickxia sporothermodurans]